MIKYYKLSIRGNKTHYKRVGIMKRIIVFVLMVFVLFYTMSGCKDNAKPSDPDTTPPAATPTPFAAVADFETGTGVSLITCSDCTNGISFWGNAGSSCDFYGVDTAGLAAENGSYYYSMTGTTKKDGTTYLGMYVYTRTSTSTGTNMTGLNYIKFQYKYSGQSSARLNVAVNNASKSMYTPVNVDIINDNAWHSASLTFTGFTNYTPAEVLPSVDSVQFGIQSSDSSAPADDTYFEFSIDNIAVSY